MSMKKLKLSTSVISNCIHWFRSWNVLNKSIHLNLFLNYYQKNTTRYMDFLRRIEIFVSLNLMVRDEIENIFLKISSFETKRDLCLINLGVRDENEIFSFKISCFEKGTRITKWNLMVEREKMKLTLVENSRDREFSLTSGTVADPLQLQGST